MVRKAFTAIIVSPALCLVMLGVASAAPNHQAEPIPLEFLTAVLEDAYYKGVLSDSHSDALSDWLIENLITQDTGETRDEARKRLSLGVDTWEAPFDFLLITLEEAYSTKVLSDKFSKALSDLFIDDLIAPASGETGLEVRERMADELASDAKSISGSYGNLTNPVPFRETAITGGGVVVTVLASNLEATEIVQGWSELNAPPDPGNKYVIARIRIYGTGDPYSDRLDYFGLVGASGRIIRADSPYRGCEWAPQGDSHGFYFKGMHGAFGIDQDETREGILCYQAPMEEEVLSIVLYETWRYSGWTEVEGFWAMFPGAPPPEPLVPPPSVSNEYGSRANPVPMGQRLLTPDGFGVSVLSANMDATEELEKSKAEGYEPPAEGNKYVTVRVRIEAVTRLEGYRNQLRWISDRNFGIVTSLGRVSHRDWRLDCGSAPDRIEEMEIFKGGWSEGFLCFEIPSGETGLTLYYREGYDYGRGYNPVFWSISSGGASYTPSESPRAISDTYGTLAGPVPAGESALASDGLSITILNTSKVAHRWGGERLKIHSRVEYFGEVGLQILDADNFGVVRSSGMITHGSRYEGCGEHIQDPRAEVIPDGWQEYEICFEGLAEEDDGLILFYLPEGTDRVLGFWAVSPDFSPRTGEPPPTPISETYGTLASPVPAGEKAVASNDVAISVTSAIIDATLLGYESSDTHKSVVVRARVESFDQDRVRTRNVSERDFGIVGVSGTLNPDNVKSECYWYDEMSVRAFRGGWQEVNLCFTVPTSETERLSIYYQPRGADRPLGFWVLPPTPAPPGIPAISDTYGTSQNPVPLGEKALVSGGIAISVVPVDVDVTQGTGSSVGILSPGSGMEYAIVRLRVENHTGYGSAIKRSYIEILDGSRTSIVVQPDDFGLIGPSGQAISRANSFWGCGMEPDEFYTELPTNGSIEANVCFRISVEDTEGLVLYYNPSGTYRVMGFWSLSADAPRRAPLNPAKPISDDYGTRTSPVPLGENALASNGYAISVLSADMDAAEEGTDNEVRGLLIRVENHSASENLIPEVNSTDFEMLTSSGMTSYRWLSGCAFRPESAEGYIVFKDAVFGGGSIERSLCYQIPKDGSGLTLFYRPGDSVLGFWEISEATSTPAPLPRPREISDDYGSWMNPVPLGEKALASDGIAIRLSEVSDIDKIIEDSGGYFPPAQAGQKYFVVRARIENFLEDEADELASVFHAQFSILTTSSDMVTSDRYGCGYESNSPVISVYPFPGQLETVYMFKSGWAEGYLCFQVPDTDTVQSVLYRHTTDSYGGYWSQTGPALGFWAVSEDSPTYTPTEPGTPISDTYGKIDSPVPAGEKAVASDGIAVTVVSANLNANSEFWSPPEPGNKYILVRIRAENTSSRWDEIRELGRRDFGIALSSGLLRNMYDSYNPSRAMCHWVEIPDEFEARIFGGMSYEGNLCFQIPVDETAAPAIFYMPSDTADVPAPPGLHAPYDPEILDPYVLGYWALPKE